jgi:iron complex transport system permease protein
MSGIPSRAAALPLAIAALTGACLLSLAVGSRQIPVDLALAAIVDRAAARSGQPLVEAIVWDVRLPRTVVGVLVGAALGLSGALMQGLTRNPLADPGLLGVSAGASFAIVVAVAVAGISTPAGYVWFAFAGALAGAGAVYLLGGLGRGGATPVRTALAGIAVTFLLGSFTSALLVRNPGALNRHRFWAAGSLAGPDLDVLGQVTPFLLAGAALALAAAPALNSLALGDEIALGLGRRLGLVRLQVAVAVTLLTGAAVAVAGPIVFVGLVVPHLVRVVTGPDHRWLLPLTTLLAGCLLLLADVAGRVIAAPQEIQAGIVVAFLGGPFFVALVRRRRLAEL